VQPTPLAASEIVAFLKADFGWTVVAIYEAARLTRNTLGRNYQREYQSKDLIGMLHYQVCRDINPDIAGRA